jgi:hypothetical protein
MSVSQIELLERLSGDVKARDSMPSTEQYRQCIEHAVADYSRRRPRQKVTTLSIVEGTASYTLPTEFIRLVRLEAPAVLEANDGGVLITSAGLVPFSADWREHYTIAAGQITFHPTPTYATSRDLWYAAGHVLDTSGDYAEMTEDDVEILLHRARSLALELQAGKAAQEAWQYAIGDERVAKEKLAAELRAASEQAEKRYQQALERAIGPAGMPSRYDSLGR